LTAGPVQNGNSTRNLLLDTVRDTLLCVVEIGGNRLLDFDETTLASCRELQGRCIAIEITDIDTRIYCHPGSWGIRLAGSAPSREVDAVISGRLMALVALASEQDKAATSMQEKVSFHGDVKLAQRLQRVLANIDIDWEEALARITGDVAAVQLHRGARVFTGWLKQSAESLLQTSSEYLREEARLSPTQVEFEAFRTRVNELRQDIARAEARLERILAGQRPA